MHKYSKYIADDVLGRGNLGGQTTPPRDGHDRASSLRGWADAPARH
ncbi:MULTISPECIES: hypothetical protein [Rhodococcus]|nr:hypothetical protein [Rhodococcus globerulus]